MSAGIPKRSRSTLQLPPGKLPRALAFFRRSDVLLRIGICALAAIMMLAITRGGPGRRHFPTASDSRRCATLWRESTSMSTTKRQRSALEPRHGRKLPGCTPTMPSAWMPCSWPSPTRLSDSSRLKTTTMWTSRFGTSSLHLPRCKTSSTRRPGKPLSSKCARHWPAMRI